MVAHYRKLTMKNIFCLLAMLTVIGCTTPYQEMGIAGGVSASQIDSRTVIIRARGNGYTSTDTIRDYALMKAAEVTKEKGFDRFIILDGSNENKSSYAQISPGQANTQFFGSSMTTTYNAPAAIPIHKASTEITIRMFYLDELKDYNTNSYAANEVIEYVGPRIK